jgi:hypothetical protein
MIGRTFYGGLRLRERSQQGVAHFYGTVVCTINLITRLYASKISIGKIDSELPAWGWDMKGMSNQLKRGFPCDSLQSFSSPRDTSRFTDIAASRPTAGIGLSSVSESVAAKWNVRSW